MDIWYKNLLAFNAIIIVIINKIDIKVDRSGAKTEISGGNVTLSTESFTMDDQVFNSESFEIPIGKPINAGASICILNLHTVFIEIFISLISLRNYFSQLI